MRVNYIVVRGKGNPNEESGAYQQVISALYAVAYTLKMSYKTDYKMLLQRSAKHSLGILLEKRKFQFYTNNNLSNT